LPPSRHNAAPQASDRLPQRAELIRDLAKNKPEGRGVAGEQDPLARCNPVKTEATMMTMIS
jgi:hypothetical protein